ncbi:pyroglutamyl-peptidase [Apiospora kogelbergensis]|uniref:pyroglutamyl-peptidase n=1 Tax=Apiospora kogelbergensis TaxID=1337665 RepID=UPI0031320591
MSHRTFNVAVTGNRPFMKYNFNTSQLVRDALPNIITRPDKRDIRILKYARDTHDTYEDVRRVSHDIWDGERPLFLPKPGPGEDERHVEIDAVLHLGMIALGGDPTQFRFETIARRDGYELPGDDGTHVDSDELRRLGLPESLRTSFDVEAAWRRVQQEHPGVVSCVSDDAGLYFCEFRFYSSLAETLLTERFRAKEGRVLFQHLPQAHDPKTIRLARDITVTYIGALADDPIVGGTRSTP